VLRFGLLCQLRSTQGVTSSKRESLRYGISNPCVSHYVVRALANRSSSFMRRPSDQSHSRHWSQNQFAARLFAREFDCIKRTSNTIVAFYRPMHCSVDAPMCREDADYSTSMLACGYAHSCHGLNHQFSLLCPHFSRPLGVLPNVVLLRPLQLVPKEPIIMPGVVAKYRVAVLTARCVVAKLLGRRRHNELFSSASAYVCPFPPLA
jgi:hypothetical protein